MDNFSVVAIYMPFIVGTVLIIVSISEKDLGNQVLRDYLLFCVSLLGWQVTETLFYILDQPYIMEKDYNIKLVFAALTGVFIFRIVVGFYKINRVPSWIMNAIFVVPAITAAISLTSYSSKLLRTKFEVISVYPLNEATFGGGIWFYVNSIFTNLMVMLFGIIIVTMLIRIPKAYRISTIAFATALFFCAMGYVITFMIDPFLDFILVGCSISNLAIFFVVTKSERGDYSNIARREIFNYLDEAVFILDERGRIVDVNKAAKEWLNLMNKESIYVSFKEMLESLKDEGLIEMSLRKNDDSPEIKVKHKDIPLVYKMNEIPMLNENKNVKGTFVTLEDVTRNSLFINRLEIDAGMDPLTGLQNRYTYEELLTELNKDEYIPTSVILGDVNSLKYINDNYGHIMGDTLLSSVGNVIRESCPAKGYAARIGGDEFVIMIPNCDEEEAATICTDIRNRLDQIDGLPFKVKMALGSVTKNSPDVKLKDKVNEADKIMYFNKSKLKGRGK